MSILSAICLVSLAAAARNESLPDTVSAVPQNGTAVPADSVADVPSINLDDFVITTTKKMIKSDGAKLTYDVHEDEAAKGQSLLDLLRRVPMITVDAEDNIKVNGQSSFKIYVNGREDTMMESNYSRIFKSMPAESVKSVEVITEPGAQYDAEGTGGIINLVTETRKAENGYSGNLSLSFSNRNTSASGNVTGQVGKVIMNANVTYSDNGISKQNYDGYSETTYHTGALAGYRQRLDQSQSASFRFVTGALSMSWEPHKRHLFTWGGSYTGINATVDNSLMTTRLFNPVGVQSYAYNSYVEGSMKQKGAMANASYRFAFNDDAIHRLLVGYQFNYNNSLTNFTTETEDVENYPVELPWQLNHDDQYNREHIAQVDYSNPFGGGRHTLDVGFKGIWRHNNSFGKGYALATPDGTPGSDADFVNSVHKQDVYAGYVSYTGNFGKVGMTTGLRYEHTSMGMDIRDDAKQDFTSHLNDWVPNASVSYMFSAANSLRLSYQMRISRPTLNQLNPYKLVFPTAVMTGNPDLDCEHVNIVSLSYSNFARVLGGNVRLQYSKTNNSIISYDYFDGPVQVTTYGNYGDESKLSLSGFLSINITSKMSVSLNGAVNYTDIRADKLKQSNHGWGGNYYAAWNWRGPWDLRFNAYGGRMLHDIELQSYWTGGCYYGLGIGKDLLKNKSLHVNVNASNFFTSKQTYRSVSHTPDASYRRRNTVPLWSVGVSVSWDFGVLKEKVKHTGLDISSDDKSKVSGDSGMSGKGN